MILLLTVFCSQPLMQIPQLRLSELHQSTGDTPPGLTRTPPPGKQHERKNALDSPEAWDRFLSGSLSGSRSSTTSSNGQNDTGL